MLSRLAVIALGLPLIWRAVVWATGVPAYILPPPEAVVLALIDRWPEMLSHAGTTLVEILAGLFLGAVLGAGAALVMVLSRSIRGWVMPLLVISQAIPVFALAPLLVLWLGYGLASKIAMAVLIIFFPVTVAFYHGLGRVEPQWLELARVMDAPPRAVLSRIRTPAALPALASGLRTAAASAPIGAVVGEWVGSSSGLGYFMLHANARMQIDLMFAALFILAIMALAVYFTVSAGLNRLVYWQSDQ